MADKTRDITYNLSVKADEPKKTIKELKDDLKKFNAELENVEVGSDSFKKLSKSISETEKDLANAKKSAKDFGKESEDTANKSKGAFTSLGSTISGKVSSAFKGFGAALKANPIFFIIGIITGVIAFMKKALEPFQPLLDWISDKIAYVSGLIDGFAASLTKIGDIVSAVFSGEFGKAANMAKELTDGIEGVAEATEKLNKIMREQDAIAKENELTTLESMQHQKELETILKDTTLSIKEREDALAELKSIQEGQAQDDINEKLARYNAINEKVNDTLALQGSEIKNIGEVSSDQLADLRNAGKLTEDQFNDIVNARKELASVNAAAADVDLKLARYDVQIKREQQTADKKRSDAYIAQKAKEKKLNEDAAAKAAEDEKKLVAARAKTKEALETLEKNATLKLLKGTEGYYLKMNEYENEDYASKKKYIEDNIKDEELKKLELEKLEVEHKSRLKTIEEEYIIYKDELQVIENEKKAAKKEKEIQDAKEVADEKKRIKDEELENLNNGLNAGLQAIEIYQDAVRGEADAELKYEEKIYKIKKSNLDKQLKSGLISQEDYDKQLIDAEIAKVKKQNEINKKVFEAEKETNILKAIMATALGVSNSLSTGMPWGAVLAALSAAAGAVQISTISNQNFVPMDIPTAAGGGILAGALHAAGGMNLGGVEAEGGEFIINRASTKAYTPLLNSINQAGNTNGDNSTVNDLIDYDRLGAVIQSKKVYVVSHEITDQQDEDTKIVDRTEF